MKLQFEETFRSLWPNLNRVARSIRSKGDAVTVIEQSQTYAKLGIMKHSRGGHYFSRMEVIRPYDRNLSSSLGVVLSSEDYRDITDCIVVLPQELVSTRNLRIPAALDREIEQMVRLQARVNTPFPENDFVYGYYLVSRNDDGTCDLILYSARESVVKQRIDIIEACGERVIEVVPSSELVRRYICASSALGPMLADQSMAVVNIDFAGACILLFDSNRLVRIRAVSSGLNDSLATTTAGDRCRWQGLVADEIETTVESYRSKTPGYSINRLIITGARSLTAPLHETLKGCQSVDLITMHDQCQEMAAGSRTPDQTGNICDDYSVCAFIGLTAKEVTKSLNMLPDESKHRIRVSSTRRYLSLMLLLTLLNLALSSAYFKIDVSRKESYLAQLQAQVEETSSSTLELRRLRRQLTILGQQVGSDFGPLDVLREYYLNAPPSISIELFEYLDGNKASVSGRAAKIGDVLSYVDRLRKSQLLNEVKMDYASNTERAETKQVQFRVSARIRR